MQSRVDVSLLSADVKIDLSFWEKTIPLMGKCCLIFFFDYKLLHLIDLIYEVTKLTWLKILFLWWSLRSVIWLLIFCCLSCRKCTDAACISLATVYTHIIYINIVEVKLLLSFSVTYFWLSYFRLVAYFIQFCM